MSEVVKTGKLTVEEGARILNITVDELQMLIENEITTPNE